ncbi:MAG: gamma-glutamyltransferase family protein [Polyangiaceae bacterium]|nr:gamma-glutamyltransferase family protein [Polyangiaceae bacterium]
MIGRIRPDISACYTRAVIDPDELLFESRRSPVLCTRGAVATSHPLAAQAGLDILRAGGNAADAAVATAAALAVVEPCSTGLGGDCFALFFDAATRNVHAVNGSGRAALELAPERHRDSSGNLAWDPLGVHTVTVPGAAAGWADTVARHGRLSLAQVLAPALELAEHGFAVSPITARYWQLGEERVRAASPHGGEILPAGRAPRPGEVFANPSLGRVMRELQAGGAEAFYRGWPGEAIVDVVRSLGGALDARDLAQHACSFEPPISTTYRGVRVYECAPSGQGLTALLALNILQGFDVRGMGRRSAALYHHVVEALRLAFADARAFVADPTLSDVPVAGLLDETYAARRRACIDPRRAGVHPEAGVPERSSDTVYLAVVDGEGSACSFINSNYSGFGTGIVPRGCGFTLQNRGAGFSAAPGHPNAPAPGKRPYHTIIPALATHASGELMACFGVMGGFMQPQGHVQVLLNLVDFGLDAQAALDEPRIAIQPDPPEGDLVLEPGAPSALAALEAMGHRVTLVQGWGRSGLFGRGQLIVRDRERGVLWAGSDPRADGCAVGW